jgi:hypothetical protein
LMAARPWWALLQLSTVTLVGRLYRPLSCDRGARLAKLHGDRDLSISWRKVADEIHADICERGVDERGVFVQQYDTTVLDASVLLMPLLSFWLVSALVEIGKVARCPTPVRSSCTPRRSTRAAAGTWATSRRRSPTWP